MTDLPVLQHKRAGGARPCPAVRGFNLESLGSCTGKIGAHLMAPAARAAGCVGRGPRAPGAPPPPRPAATPPGAGRPPPAAHRAPRLWRHRVASSRRGSIRTQTVFNSPEPAGVRDSSMYLEEQVDITLGMPRACRDGAPSMGPSNPGFSASAFSSAACASPRTSRSMSIDAASLPCRSADSSVHKTNCTSTQLRPPGM
jgi:hypothetical protein